VLKTVEKYQEFDQSEVRTETNSEIRKQFTENVIATATAAILIQIANIHGENVQVDWFTSDLL